MKLWLIYQDVNNGYNSYDSAVVAASSEDAARNTYPDKFGAFFERFVFEGEWYYRNNRGEMTKECHSDWVLPKDVQVDYIGTTNKKAGIICASFNAG